MFKLFLLLVLGVLLGCNAQSQDLNENCAFWAENGECEKNPDYMLINCVASCSSVGGNNGNVASSFYDIVETDLHGNTIYFDQFEGKVVYIVNVASHCGYTQENYAMFRKLQKYRKEGLEIVLAPCNAFGAQEPGDATAIEHFTKSKNFEGIILSKDEVNGKDTRASFKFLKQITGKSHINWYVLIIFSEHVLSFPFRNFDGKFLVDRHGHVLLPGEDIEADIKRLLQF